MIHQKQKNIQTNEQKKHFPYPVDFAFLEYVWEIILSIF